MIRTILKYGILLIAGILTYNYFLGTPAEKQSSKKIFTEIKDVGNEVGNLLKAEKEKFDKGKYDGALKKVGNVYKNLKEKAKNLDEKVLSRLDDLDDRRKDLEERLEEVSDENSDEGKKQSKKLQDDLDNLLEETQDLIRTIKPKE